MINDFHIQHLAVHEDVLKHLPVPLQNPSTVLELVQAPDIMLAHTRPVHRD